MHLKPTDSYLFNHGTFDRVGLIVFAVISTPWPCVLLFGMIESGRVEFDHLFALFGTTVMVPLLWLVGIQRAATVKIDDRGVSRHLFGIQFMTTRWGEINRIRSRVSVFDGGSVIIERKPRDSTKGTFKIRMPFSIQGDMRHFGLLKSVISNYARLHSVPLLKKSPDNQSSCKSKAERTAWEKVGLPADEL